MSGAVVAGLKAELEGLSKKRDDIEVELSALAEVLKSPTADGNPGPGLKGKLVDSEGFPRYARIHPMKSIHLFAPRLRPHSTVIGYRY
jgi:hypothetical protein